MGGDKDINFDSLINYEKKRVKASLDIYNNEDVDIPFYKNIKDYGSEPIYLRYYLVGNDKYGYCNAWIQKEEDYINELE